MNSEAGSAIIIILIGLFPTYIALFQFKKDVVLNTDKYPVFREFLPLPASVNFWVFKLFMLIGGILISLLGFYLFIRSQGKKNFFFALKDIKLVL
ncbi:hypothetical protein [Planococcus sp. SSTMD024]|uniref:hypothetical protein n=1 Tax=Planococcus sp. SSTMD024 TaxID=3242163 RepID=UPI00351EB286